MLSTASNLGHLRFISMHFPVYESSAEFAAPELVAVYRQT